MVTDASSAGFRIPALDADSHAFVTPGCRLGRLNIHMPCHVASQSATAASNVQSIKTETISQEWVELPTAVQSCDAEASFFVCDLAQKGLG